MHLPARHQMTFLAPWSLRIALLALQLIIATAVLHRFAGFPTAIAVNLVVVSLAGCILAVLAAALALVQIWRHGKPGTGAAATAMMIGSLILVVPSYYVPMTLRELPVSDVATDLEHPPVFQALARSRQGAGLNPQSQPTQGLAAETELEPIVTDRSPGDVFDLTNEVVRQMDLNIVAEQAPGFGAVDGSLEATERTAILGLTDDIALRISPDQGQTRVDIRSAARYPRLDFGRNGERVRLILAKLQSAIESSVPSDPSAVALGGQGLDGGPTSSLRPGGTSGAGTVIRRKKRSLAPASAPNGPAPTVLRH